MRVAIVYDRLNKIGGAERVLQAFAKLYPQADWYTSLWDKQGAPFSANWNVQTSWLNRIKALRLHHEWIPYLMPFVFESFNFDGYDLVISVGSAESKGILTKPSTKHLNYCLTPTRYLYSHSHHYLKNPLTRMVGRYLRKWDLVASTRPDEMIAISTQVKKRIQKVYKRDAKIIFPPLDLDRFSQTSVSKTTKYQFPYSNYFLVVSRLVSYKRIEVLIKAANQTKTNLLIIGTGNQFHNLSALAGPTVKLLGYVEDQALPAYYQHAKAYLQANEEDFGISMCESLASGTPVIAYGRGGALDIVTGGECGILLKDNSVASFALAFKQFDTMTFTPQASRARARRFAQTTWVKHMQERIKQICQ